MIVKVLIIKTVEKIACTIVRVYNDDDDDVGLEISCYQTSSSTRYKVMTTANSLSSKMYKTATWLHRKRETGPLKYK